MKQIREDVAIFTVLQCRVTLLSLLTFDIDKTLENVYTDITNIVLYRMFLPVNLS